MKIIDPKISVCPKCKVRDPSFIINVEPNELHCSCTLCGGIIILKTKKDNKIIVKEECNNV